MLFFFSSRRRHTRYWRDWSSDVCSSDLRAATSSGGWVRAGPVRQREDRAPVARRAVDAEETGLHREIEPAALLDRKSVGWGKSVDLGGRRIIKKKKQIRPPHNGSIKSDS